MLKTATAAALLASAALGQTLTVPQAAIGADLPSSSGWPFDIATIQIQYIYDSSHFTGQGINFPILINGLKVRANATTTTWNGGTSQLQVDMSTAPLDYASITNTFASNHGADQATVFNGNLTVLPGSSTAGTPGPYHVDIVFASPFLYDPSTGNDLTIDYISSGITAADMPLLDTSSTTGQALARRTYNFTLGQPTGTIWAGESAHALEFSYTPAAGIYASFQADTTSGPSPLAVNFTDTSFTDDPSGVLQWAWDLDGNGSIDSTLQNPSFTYPSCGDYDVTLTVTDTLNGSNTTTVAGYIKVDDVTLAPTFSTTPLSPTVIQFSDTTVPTPTSVDWDFTGDGIPDASGPTVVWAFPAACTAASVTQFASLNCRGPFTNTQSIVVGATTVDTSPLGGAGTQSSTWVGVLLDIDVQSPVGLSVCALTINTYTFSGPYDVQVYLTPDTYVGKESTIDDWRLIGEGTGTAGAVGTTANPDTSIAIMNTPFYLPFGQYGFAVYISQPSGNAGISYISTSQGPQGNADITFYPNGGGVSRTGLFSGSLFGPSRHWNGELHYTTCTTAFTPGYGFFGPGCPGSTATATNVGTTPPALNQNMVAQFDNIPFNAGLLLIGLSNTFSPTIGPLPLDVSPFGLTGCTARVDPALSYFFLGAANSITASLFIPNDPNLLCAQIYTQMFVFDTGANPFGGVLSDAAAAVIGQ